MTGVLKEEGKMDTDAQGEFHVRTQAEKEQYSYRPGTPKPAGPPPEIRKGQRRKLLRITGGAWLSTR